MSSVVFLFVLSTFEAILLQAFFGLITDPGASDFVVLSCDRWLDD